MSGPSFLWHDYETFGADAARDRPAQFAAIRTDVDLNPIGEPLEWFCQPVIDVLPHPDAVLLTGITPQQAQRDGVPEYRFAELIHDAFMHPGTCGVGYNSIRFDDEFTRHLFYRNFFDPYQREWYGGNSRWDLIDVVRLWHALRPEGLEWPQRESGATSFKLEHLTAANGLLHEQAHDALSDVRATIALAQKLKRAQPRLFAHALKLRDKHYAQSLLALEPMAPVLHVSSKIPASRGCLAVVVPLARHPTNSNCVLTFDLDGDVDALLDLDADALHERVFAKDADLPEGMRRLPLKGVHLNKAPMLAPLSTMTPEQQGRWGINLEHCQKQRDRLFAARALIQDKVQSVFAQSAFDERDAELNLYAGFIPDADKAHSLKVRQASADALWQLQGGFRDPRLNDLLFRYRARHWPDRLTDEEVVQWEAYVRSKLLFEHDVASLGFDAYQEILAARLHQLVSPQQRLLLQKLLDWPVESGVSRWLRE